nr:nitroreductase family protein [Sedimentibacter sp.]
MEFKKLATELIKTRTSTRTFDSKSIDKKILQQFNDYISEINSEAKIKARFKLISNDDIVDNEPKKLGTYGVISGTNSYIIGILDKDEKNAVEFGFLFEKIILFATDLGLQTCWLGGTFNKNDFEQKSSLLENEFIPIISPVGIKRDKPRALEITMRAIAGSNKRKSWSELFFDKDISLPLTEICSGKYNIPLEMVRLGPSASNKQPWRIIKENELYHFFLCRTKGYGVANFDIQKNDLGIAMCHFELASKELGLNGKWGKAENVVVPNEWEYVFTWISTE